MLLPSPLSVTQGAPLSWGVTPIHERRRHAALPALSNELRRQPTPQGAF